MKKKKKTKKKRRAKETERNCSKKKNEKRLNRRGVLSSNFIYFTTITKQVIQLVLIMLVGTDVCVPVVFVLEETGVPGGSPPV